MSRQAKIIIFSLLLIYSVYNNRNNSSLFDWKEIKENILEKSNDQKSPIIPPHLKENKKIKQPNTVNKNLNDQKSLIINFEAKVSKKSIGLNERLRVDFIMNKNGDNFTAPNFSNFRVIDGPNQSISNSWVDSKRVFKKTFTYFLSPKRKGTATIKPATVEINEKVYATNSIKIKVSGGVNKTNVINKSDDTPKLFNLDSPDYNYIPKSGFSPYDNYFGKGVYRETENSIIVSAPKKSHVVFIVIDTYSKKRVRNEFIRKGETFSMTKIPYGTYDYMYFTGRNWSNEVFINNGNIKGGFKDYPSFSKNKVNNDQMEFERGYTGSYTIKLTQTTVGNLKMSSATESQFFE